MDHSTTSDTPTCMSGPGTVTPAGILAEAGRLVSADRARQYGDYRDSMADIADAWNVYLDHCLRPSDIAVMMALLKIARMKAAPLNPDNYVDAVGYLAIAGALAAVEKGSGAKP